MSRNNEKIDVEVMLHLDRPAAAAILVSDDGDRAKAVWLPRSQIEYDQDASEGDVITVTMPEWLAKKAGLI